MQNIYEKLYNAILQNLSGGVAVAFSGGVDSALALRVADKAAKKTGEKLYAVTFKTKLHSADDIALAEKLCKDWGVKHKILSIDEFTSASVINNAPDRCYHCKKQMFEKLIEFCAQNGVKNIMDGTNADDLSQYRPGIKAVKELGVISPLAESGITKAQTRQIAEYLGISVAKRPSAPCFATRFPYNAGINFAMIEKISKAEDIIKSKGFDVVRLRLHGDIARIEIERSKLADFAPFAEEISDKLKSLGFKYITLDLEGFRSGSMDE